MAFKFGNALAAVTDPHIHECLKKLGLAMHNESQTVSALNSTAVSTPTVTTPTGPGSGPTGTGTTNYLTKWTDGPGRVIGDSLVSDDGTNVTFHGASFGATLDLQFLTSSQTYYLTDTHGGGSIPTYGNSPADQYRYYAMFDSNYNLVYPTFGAADRGIIGENGLIRFYNSDSFGTSFTGSFRFYGSDKYMNLSVSDSLNRAQYDVPGTGGYHEFIGGSTGDIVIVDGKAKINSTLTMTTGLFNSGVADGANAIAYDFRASASMAAGYDRILFRIANNGATAMPVIVTNDYNLVLGSTALPSATVPSTIYSAGALATIASGQSGSCWMQPASIGGSGATILGTSAVNRKDVATFGGVFVGRSSTNTSAVRAYGGAFYNGFVTAASASTEVYGGLFAATSAWGTSGTSAVAEMGGCLIEASTAPGPSSPTVTDWYQLRIKNASTSASNPPTSKPSITTLYGIRLAQMTKGTTNYGIWLDNATDGYKAIAIRDTDVWIGSNAAGELSLNGTSFNVVFYDDDIVSYDDDMVVY